MPNSLSLFWGDGHSVHFATFPILQFSKCYLTNNFHRMASKLYENVAYHGAMQASTLLGNRPSFTKFMALIKVQFMVEILTLVSMGNPS